MRKRILSVGLALALLLTVSLPSVALADGAESFDAAGTVTGISPGVVYPIGGSGRWRVAERELTGMLSGDINGPFTVTYSAIIESLLTQAGKFRGILEAGPDTLKVKGEILPLEVADWFGTGQPLPRLTFNGKWKFTGDIEGRGTFAGWLIFVPTPDGHVGWVLASEFTMVGEWDPDDDDHHDNDEDDDHEDDDDD